MSLPRYPAYKDSGVSWLGEVPAHWRVDRFKNVVRLRQEIVGNKASDYLLLSLTLQGVIPRDMDNPQGKFPSSFDTYQVVKKGDVVFCLFDVEETPRGVGLCNEEGMLTGAYTVVRPLDAFDSRFVFYYYYARDQYKAWRMYYTGLRNVIRWDNFGSIPFLAPSLEEQREISDFLDRETAKIDALIAEQEKLIALLAEKRQATISRAVTRGLDPSVPLKDTGVPWLGKVPAHWGVSALGYIASLQTGSTPDRGVSRYWNGTIPWIKTGEINWVSIRDAEEFITAEGLANSAAKISPPGTLLMAMYGQGVTRGRVALLEIEAAYNQACVAIRFDHRCIPEFGRYFFMAAYGNIRDAGNETSQMNLSAGYVSKIRMPLPSLPEQKAVVKFLDHELKKLDELELSATVSISLLKERRAALISAAVTGKIDVRGLAA